MNKQLLEDRRKDLLSQYQDPSLMSSQRRDAMNWAGGMQEAMSQLPKELAAKTLRAMDVRERSWVDRGSGVAGSYGKTLQAAFDEVFKDDPMKQPLYLATRLAWNDIESWCNELLKEE